MHRVKQIKVQARKNNPDEYEVPPRMLMQVSQKKEITISFDMAIIAKPLEDEIEENSEEPGNMQNRNTANECNREANLSKPKSCCTMM